MGQADTVRTERPRGSQTLEALPSGTRRSSLVTHCFPKVKDHSEGQLCLRHWKSCPELVKPASRPLGYHSLPSSLKLWPLSEFSLNRVDALRNHLEIVGFKLCRCQTSSLPHPGMPLGPPVSHKATGVTLSQGWHRSGCPAGRLLPGPVECRVSQTDTHVHKHPVYWRPRPKEQAVGERPEAVCEFTLLPIKKLPRPWLQEPPRQVSF